MNRNNVYANEKSIVGLWANIVIADVGTDESVVVFDSNGTGFIHYTQIDYEIIETFRWYMNNEYLNVQGQEMFNTDNGVLKKVGQSTVNVTNIQVHFGLTPKLWTQALLFLLFLSFLYFRLSFHMSFKAM